MTRNNKVNKQFNPKHPEKYEHKTIGNNSYAQKKVRVNIKKRQFQKEKKRRF